VFLHGAAEWLITRPYRISYSLLLEWCNRARLKSLRKIPPT